MSGRRPPFLITPILGACLLAASWPILGRWSGGGPGGGEARADVVEDALRCLERQAEGERRRERLLLQADSLGGRIEDAQSGGRSAPGSLLRRAERLQREALDLELELLVQRQGCREETARAIAFCDSSLRRLEVDLGGGGGDPGRARDLLRLRAARDRLEAQSAPVASLGYPLLPPDSLDTQESLRAKLLYHDDLRDHLGGLLRRLDVRRDQVAEERRTLIEARRFVDDLSFLDEGGRVAPRGDRALPSAPNGSPAPEPGLAGRQAVPSGPGTVGGQIELVLGWAPTSAEESDRLLAALDGFRTEIRREIDLVLRTREAILARILPDAGTPR